MLKNANGKYCYRYTPKGKWLLSSKHRTDANFSAASIAAKEGPLPVGAHTWQCWDGGKFVDGTLTVGLLVRSPLPSPAACTSSLVRNRFPE